MSRADDRQIEPIRVEFVAFSPERHDVVGQEDGETWMATFDSWQDREYAAETHLKIWIGYPRLGSAQRRPYTVNTRIDLPHGTARLSSMVFSSSALGKPRLATTSSDGLIKIWSHGTSSTQSQVNGAWLCLLSFHYRSIVCIDAAFSPDNSLLAVAHLGHITLWSANEGTLLKVLHAETSVGSIKKVRFAGKEGTRLVFGGTTGMQIWDILTCEGKSRSIAA